MKMFNYIFLRKTEENDVISESKSDCYTQISKKKRLAFEKAWGEGRNGMTKIEKSKGRC